jgi:hypothetical protein
VSASDSEDDARRKRRRQRKEEKRAERRARKEKEARRAERKKEKRDKEEEAGKGGAKTMIWDRDAVLGVGGKMLDDAKRASMIRDAAGLKDRFGSSGFSR